MLCEKLKTKKAIFLAKSIILPSADQLDLKDDPVTLAMESQKNYTKFFAGYSAK